MTSPSLARHGGQARGGPDSLYVLAPGLSDDACRRLAEEATRLAKLRAPRLSGRSAKGLRPFWGAGFFGVSWTDAYVWFHEKGAGSHTMRRLAGKTIPMWLDDPVGDLRRADPKAKTRVTADGRRQVLVFRRAAPIGQRKSVRRRVGGAEVVLSVPAAYPGAPGRIANRDALGRTQTANVGVRWRHPGLRPRGFIAEAVLSMAEAAGLGRPQPQVTSRVQ